MGQDSYRRLPSRTSDNCFACGQNHPSGLRMTFFTDGERVLSWPKVPKHLSGWSNLVHGGVISTMLDEIMGWAAVRLLKKMSLTRSITVDFLKPVYVEEELTLEASVKAMHGEREALMESSLRDGKGELCAVAVGTFALFAFDAIRKRAIVDNELLDELERLVSDP